jgi:hypothetical protein
MKKITINKKKYNIKYTIRALFIYERITGKSFKIETLLDNYIFFYSMILACNPNDLLDWDDYLDALDNDPTLFDQIQKIVEEEQKEAKMFKENEKDDEGKKA